MLLDAAYRSLFAVLAVAPLLASCVGTDTVTCRDGLACPAKNRCVTITPAPAEQVCSPPDDPCPSLADHHRCSTTTVQTGRCYDGACVAVACGNGRSDTVDPADPT